MHLCARKMRAARFFQQDTIILLATGNKLHLNRWGQWRALVVQWVGGLEALVGLEL